MTKEELEKNYYANRPIEPYSSDDSPNGWANIAHYAEENLERAFKRIVELECECRRCIYTDCPCILSDFGKDRNGICDHFKDVFDENVELREQLNKNPYVCNTEWHCNDCLEQLTKAKELLTRFVMASVYFNGKEKELVEEAEQFLKETEQ